jgi:hypothetical protein
MIDLVDAVLLDTDLSPLGPPAATPEGTRWFAPSPDGRFFAAYSIDGHVHLFRSTGELVGALAVPNANAETDKGIAFTFSGDGSRLAGYLLYGNRAWAIWDTETGEVVDSGGPEVLQRPKFAGDVLYSERGANEFALVPRDPVSYQPIGPPFGNFFTQSIVADGKGELVATRDDKGYVRVYDTATWTQIGREIAGATGTQFAASGTTLMVIAGDHISIWNFDTATWPDIACDLAGRNLSREEWDEFGPRIIEYRATCPQFPLEP